LEVIFRIPGREYAFAEVKVTGADPLEIMRNLRDMDGNFWVTVGNALEAGCSSAALGPLQPNVIAEYDNGPQHQVATPDGYREPVWAQNAPQEAQQPYPAPTTQQGGYAPQNGPQGYTGGYQQPQQYTPQPPQAPPGQSAPVCGHGVPMTYHGPGKNRAGKDYGASWRCAAKVAREQQCKAQWLDN